MSITEDLGTEYHQQDTNYYCGAACAQMILEECGAGHLDQVGLYNDNHTHSVQESGWYTAPDGLRWTLNNRQSTKYFVLDALATEDAISRMLAWTIHHYKIAPAALVFGWQHWIVVRGFGASAAPTSSADVSYTLNSFTVNNPWPPTPAGSAEPPHSTGDGCGTGGNRGVANEHISYSTWQTDYMTGVPGGFWIGKFVAVCDPDAPPEGRPEPQRPQRPPFDGQELLQAGVAAELAHKYLHGIRETGPKAWREFSPNAVPGTPLMVQRLDRYDSFYWIVPMGEGGAPQFAVNVDARFGTYQQARLLGKSDRTALLQLSDREIKKAVSGRLVPLPDTDGEVRIRPDLACISKHWVWKPCRQSLSPYYPFKQISYGPHQFWLRSDGELFTSLTTLGRGI